MYGYDNANAPMSVSPMATAPAYGTFCCDGGYPYAGVGGAGYGAGYGYGGFALIVVLFILLIIIGACCSFAW